METERRDELPKWIRKAQNGDKEAFKEIFEHLSNKLFSYALLRAQNRDDAMDVVQDTFIELWAALDKFDYRSPEAFHGFVFTILKRRLYRHYQNKTSDVPLDETLIRDSYEMEPNDYRYMLKNIATLSSDHQDLLRLRYWSGMTYGEIASAMNINENTAKVWHHRAIKKLRDSLIEYNGTI